MRHTVSVAMAAGRVMASADRRLVFRVWTQASTKGLLFSRLIIKLWSSIKCSKIYIFVFFFSCVCISHSSISHLLCEQPSFLCSNEKLHFVYPFSMEWANAIEQCIQWLLFTAIMQAMEMSHKDAVYLYGILEYVSVYPGCGIHRPKSFLYILYICHYYTCIS